MLMACVMEALALPDTCLKTAFDVQWNTMGTMWSYREFKCSRKECACFVSHMVIANVGLESVLKLARNILYISSSMGSRS